MTTGKEILDIAMDDNDADAATVRDYLKALLTGLWEQGEGFSGKRPFGSSGWQLELYEALGRAGVVKAEEDEDGYIEVLEDGEADALILAAIEAL